MKSKENEPDFISYIRSGDTKGLREIYSRFLPRILSFITNNGGSADDAHDVFQDAILILYEKSKDKKFQLSSSFYTLLYGICRNLWGNRLQRSSFKNVTLSDQAKYMEADSMTIQFEKVEEEKVFWDSFKKLGMDCQKLLQLFFEKVKMEEITVQLGLPSVGATKKRKFACKEKLISLIKDDIRYDELKLN